MCTVQAFLAACFSGPEHVEGDARHHRIEPAAQILDFFGIGSGEPEPGFLHCVLGFEE
jgi:hypothetical protein